LFSASREREALARLFALDVRSLSEREQRAVERVRRFWSRELSAPEDVAQLTGVGAKATLRGENFFRTRAGLLRVPIDARIEVLSGGQLGVVHIGPLTEPHSAGVIDIETGAPLFTNAQIGMHATSVAVLQNRSALVSGYDAAREPILRLRYGNRSLSESFFHRPSWASADCSIGIFLFAGADARGSLDRNDRTDARLVQVFNEGPARRGTLDAGAASVRVAINGQRVRGYAVPVSQSGEALDITARVLGIGFVSLDGALLSSATFPAGASPASAFAGMRDILQGRKRFLDCEAEMSDTVFQNSEGGANLDPPYFRGRLAHIDQAQTLSRYFAEQAGTASGPRAHRLWWSDTGWGRLESSFSAVRTVCARALLQMVD
jgi:hypothetical protein